MRRLATGGMAEVYEAKRVGPHGFSKRLALKRISPEQLWSGIAAQRAGRLASLLAFRDGDLCFVEGLASGEDALALPAAPTAFVPGAAVRRL